MNKEIPILRCHDLFAPIGWVSIDDSGVTVNIAPEARVILGVLLQAFQVVQVLESYEEGANTYITKAKVIAFSIP